jgi:hypothetical protein
MQWFSKHVSTTESVFCVIRGKDLSWRQSALQEVLPRLGVSKTRTTPLHPQSDGMVERYIKTIEEHLPKVVASHQRDWGDRLPLFLLAYRASTHDTTGSTPPSLVFGQELRLPCDLQFWVPHRQGKPHNRLCGRLSGSSTHPQLCLPTPEAGQRPDENPVRHTSQLQRLPRGRQSVALSPNPKGKSLQLQSSWEGPNKVVIRINDGVYMILKNPRSRMMALQLDRPAPYQGAARDERT